MFKGSAICNLAPKMKHYYFILSIIIVAFSCSSSKRQQKKQDQIPNVLLIAFDNLNDWVGCLDGHPDTRTPNIDRLAERGLLFTNAHCQAPICNPSRTSIMFGMRPSTTGFYKNKVHGPRFQAFTGKHVSMPRSFAARGYKTLTAGKIYHGSALPPNDFEVVGPRPGQRNDLDEVIQTDRPDEMQLLWDFGPQSYAEEKFNDYVDASWASNTLQGKHNRPFFMVLGFYRPHVPFFSRERAHNSPDLLSIYPTLMELCGLSANPEIEGVSLKLLLENPEAEWEHPAMTTLMQNNHTVRTQRWRYIRYADGSKELYDHENDPNEWANLAKKPEMAEEVARLQNLLPKINVEQMKADKA